MTDEAKDAMDPAAPAPDDLVAEDSPEDVAGALSRALEEETSPLGRDILDKLLHNARIAREERIPICQDCGVAVVFVEAGQEAHLTGDLYAAIEEGVRIGYREGYLRKSMVRDPLRRSTNTGDNTPPVVHVRLVPGDRLKLTVPPKGGGSENMSAVWLLVPADSAPTAATLDWSLSPVGQVSARGNRNALRVLFKLSSAPNGQGNVVWLEGLYLASSDNWVSVGTLPVYRGDGPLIWPVEAYALGVDNSWHRIGTTTVVAPPLPPPGDVQPPLRGK